MNQDPPEKYEEDVSEYRLKFSRTCAYAAIILILLGVGLDYGLYPDKQLLFGSFRVFFSLLTYGIILALGTKWGREHLVILTFTWLLFPQLMITLMIGLVNGGTSMYSIGLYLAIFASSIALPFSIRHNIALSLITFILYMLACLWNPKSYEPQGIFIANSLFLIFIIIVSAISAYYNERTRFMLFYLKAEVDEKNRLLEEVNMKLEDSNQRLAEIKGHMMQQEKMASIGALSAGVMHEVNNPVNFCMMAISLAKERPAAKTDPKLTEFMDDINAGLLRVQRIVSDLKIFAYRSDESKANVGVFQFNDAAQSALRLVHYGTKDIAIKHDLPEKTMVRGDEAAIVGVLVNLLENAALALHAAKSPNPAIELKAVWMGNRLRVTVKDNGPGISPENLLRVFEPFFTTREIGLGLGLGLSISFGVIERHGGKLAAESKPGKWTKMIFDLQSA